MCGSTAHLNTAIFENIRLGTLSLGHCLEHGGCVEQNVSRPL